MSSSMKVKPGDHLPVRYEQISAMRMNADGTCEMDFHVGPPAPSIADIGLTALQAKRASENAQPQPDDAGSGGGSGFGQGGIAAGYADPFLKSVTEFWVGQNFTYDGTCIYEQNSWPGTYQFSTSGWVLIGYSFAGGLSNLCPQCPQHPGYMTSFANGTNASFQNGLFCYNLTKTPGVTFTNYAYVSDYGFGDGSTIWTFSSTASGACSSLLHSYYTFQ